jgi:hypothetical protein
MSRSVLINTDKLQFLKACSCKDSVARLEVWAEILAPKDDFLITGEEKRCYASFTLMELKLLYRNTASRELDVDSYSKALTEVARLAEQVPDDETGFVDLLAKLGKPMPEQSAAPAPEKKSKANSSPKAKKATDPDALPSRPKEGSATAKVWEIADKLFEEFKPDLADKDFRNYVIEQAEKEGLNPSTAQVQFGKWKKVQMGSN